MVIKWNWVWGLIPLRSLSLMTPWIMQTSSVRKGLGRGGWWRIIIIPGYGHRDNVWLHYYDWWWSQCLSWAGPPSNDTPDHCTLYHTAHHPTLPGSHQQPEKEKLIYRNLEGTLYFVLVSISDMIPPLCATLPSYFDIAWCWATWQDDMDNISCFQHQQ